MELQDLFEELEERVRLIERHLSQTITADEQDKLDAWLNESPLNRTFLENIMHREFLVTLIDGYYEAKVMTSDAKERMHAFIKEQQTPKKRISNRARYWVAIAAAYIISLGIYIWFNSRQKNAISVKKQTQPALANDVAPGSFKARLTLADGSTIMLDSAAVGKLAKQGNTDVVNQKGELVYQKGKTITKEVFYNKLSTSRGEMYPVTLSDGTKVWLNSASSIYYPVVFEGNKRIVQIIGEAYFEVAKDATKPFIVALNSMEVCVLGTHFNIDAYSDDSQVRTTLLEGSVKITPKSGGQAAILKPGEQARVSAKGGIKVIENSDLEKEVAWKNRLFIFKGDDIVDVMNRLSRWYDLDVVYKESVPDLQFYGIINMDQPASNVLKLLQMKKGHFRIENKKIIVSP